MWCKRMLVGYDGSPYSHEALELAFEIAEQNRGIEIHIVHVMHLLSVGASGWGADAVLEEKAVAIQSEMDEIASRCNNSCKTETVEGTSAAETLIRYAEENACDVIVMGCAGMRGVRGYLGSVSYAVIKNSPVPVVIAKDKKRNQGKRT